MLDRLARQPGAPCLLARGTRLGGIAFYHVNFSYRATPAGQDETSHEDMAARIEFFRTYHSPVSSAEQNDNFHNFQGCHIRYLDTFAFSS